MLMISSSVVFIKVFSRSCEVSGTSTSCKTLWEPRVTTLQTLLFINLDGVSRVITSGITLPPAKSFHSNKETPSRDKLSTNCVIVN